MAETLKRDPPKGTGVFKTCGGVLREGIPMRYSTIQEHDRRDPIRLMCRVLAVSAAGYYARRSRPERPRSIQARTLLAAIRVVQSREPTDSTHLRRANQARPWHWRASRRAADASGRPPSQNCDEVACRHPVPASVPRGREYRGSCLHCRGSKSGCGSEI
jgi:hypothetical protein